MSVADKPKLDRSHVRNLLANMIRIRRFEDKCAELYTQEKIRGFLHLYDGEEAIAAGIVPRLAPDDRVVATYREHGHALDARGANDHRDGRDVRQSQWLLGRTWRIHASL